MPTILFEPAGKRVQVKHGKTLLETAQKGRIALRHRCGGNASCTTCKVIVNDSHSLSGINEKERHKLGSQLIREGYRLACQARVFQDTVVRQPEDPLKAVIRRKLEEQKDHTED